MTDVTPEDPLVRLRDTLYSSGLNEPLAALEQLTYLIVLKWVAATRHNETWSHLMTLSPPEQASFLETFAGGLIGEAEEFGKPAADALRDAVVAFPSPEVSAEAIGLVDRIWNVPPEAYGDLYERLLAVCQLSGRYSQFLTPRSLVDAMVLTTSPGSGDAVLDPACGTASFLVAARRYAKENGVALERATGIDSDASMVRLGIANLLLHGDDRPEVHHADALRDDAPRVAADVVVSNPPFAPAVDADERRYSWLGIGTARTELMFLVRCIEALAFRGRCAVVVPHGALFGTTNAHRVVRSRLLEDMRLVAVASLGPGMFRPYTDVQGAVLVFQNQPSTSRVWFTELEPDRVSRLIECRRALDTPQSIPPPSGWWAQDRQQIVSNDMNLLPSVYRRGERRLTTRPVSILEDVLEIEDELQQRLRRLRDLLTKS